MRTLSLFAALSTCLLAHTCGAAATGGGADVLSCSFMPVAGVIGQPQLECKACVANTGQHHTFGLIRRAVDRKTRSQTTDHVCAWDMEKKACVRRRKSMKEAKYAVSEAQCEAKLPLNTVVNDLDVEMGPNVKPVPSAVAQLDLRVDPDSLASYNRAPDGAVFVTFVVMPDEEVQEAHRQQSGYRSDPNTVCRHPTAGPYPAGTVFLAPGTARTTGVDAGKHTPFPWDAANKPRVGGHEQQALLPDKQPHLVLLGMLCGGPGSRAASLFVGGALFKNVKGQHQNDYRWTSGGVNSAHSRWMGNNKQGKEVVPVSLQRSWNAELDHLLNGLPEPAGTPKKLSAATRNSPKNKGTRQLLGV